MNELTDYYSKRDENERLFRDNAHKIEWLTTIKYLEKYIPANAKILDCCAGTGRYSFWLAQNGFHVTAGDIMQKHIEHMRLDKRAHLLDDILLCDALDMSDLRTIVLMSFYAWGLITIYMRNTNAKGQLANA